MCNKILECPFYSTYCSVEPTIMRKGYWWIQKWQPTHTELQSTVQEMWFAYPFCLCVAKLHSRKEEGAVPKQKKIASGATFRRHTVQSKRRSRNVFFSNGILLGHSNNQKVDKKQTLSFSNIQFLPIVGFGKQPNLVNAHHSCSTGISVNSTKPAHTSETNLEAMKFF